MEPAADRAVVCDVNETLIDLSGLRDAMALAGLDAQDLPLWFARTQRDGFGLAAAGDWRSFRDVGIAVLEQMGAQPVAAHAVLDALAACPLHPDVPTGIAALQRAGFRVATLTVGSSALVAQTFMSAGITDVTHLSCDAVQRWKPAPEPYRYAMDHLATRELTMIAAHQWDLHGAARVGYATAWLNRSGVRPNAIYPPPDLQAPSLIDVAEILV